MRFPTHGGMTSGAESMVAERFGTLERMDPRLSAHGSLGDT
jgi:predicted GTPase